jgi:peptide/nickel transport system permease protein
MTVTSGLQGPEPADGLPETSPPGRMPDRRLSRIGRALKPFRDARGQSKWLLWIGVTLTVAFVVVGVLAPWLAPYDFNQVSTVDGGRFPKQAPPSADHWFGTSVRSEDVLSRVIYGARTAVEVTALAVIVSLTVGVPLGLISGYFGGWLDRVMVLIADALFAFPYLLLAIVIAFLLQDAIGGGVITAALAITVVYVPQYFRVVRNSTLSAREATYVEAARALGARPRTVIGRYIFGNVVHSVPVIATLNAADAMLTLAGLGFLGYGIQPTEGAEWGYDLQRAIPDIAADIWWTGVFPGMAIVVFVVALTLVGEGLNDTLNPNLRKRRIEAVRIPPRPAAVDERTDG